jgi:hypothetical protein
MTVTQRGASNYVIQLANGKAKSNQSKGEHIDRQLRCSNQTQNNWNRLSLDNWIE